MNCYKKITIKDFLYKTRYKQTSSEVLKNKVVTGAEYLLIEINVIFN